MYACAAIAIFSGSCLLYFYYHNKNRKIERYYFQESKKLFGILQFVISILMISTVMNGRFIASELLQMLTKNIYKLKGGELL